MNLSHGQSAGRFPAIACLCVCVWADGVQAVLWASWFALYSSSGCLGVLLLSVVCGNKHSKAGCSCEVEKQLVKIVFLMVMCWFLPLPFLFFPWSSFLCSLHSPSYTSGICYILILPIRSSFLNKVCIIQKRLGLISVVHKNFKAWVYWYHWFPPKGETTQRVWGSGWDTGEGVCVVTVATVLYRRG